MIAILLGAVKPVMGTPPHDIELKYDSGNQVLHVSMKHPTVDIHLHYIRTIEVILNNGEPQVYRYNFQKAWGQEADIQLAMKPGDTVHLKATCIKGGSAEAELTLPAEDLKNTK